MRVSPTTYDDPIWEYTLVTRLMPYKEAVDKFWDNVDSIPVIGTGIYAIPDSPPGLMYRVTNTPVRSPIKGVQIFPFVPTAYLQITGVAGGVNKMITRICKDGNIKLDKYTIVEKSNLPSTYHKGQFVAFIPTDILDGARRLGRWVYLTTPEMIGLVQGEVLTAVKQKVVKCL